MQCNICKQNSIYVEIDHENIFHIKCKICGLDFKKEEEGTKSLIDLVIYDLDLLTAFKEGKKHFILEKEDNPYSFNDVFLRKKWEEGYKESEEEMEKEGLISSSKKLSEELEQLSRENKDLILLNKQYSEWNNTVFNVFEELKKKKYLWGFSYRKRIKKIYKIMERVGSKILNLK